MSKQQSSLNSFFGGGGGASPSAGAAAASSKSASSADASRKKKKQQEAKEQRAATKRANLENEKDAKVLKKAKPSISKAAEELMCPILQGLPIDPVIAEDGQIYEREEIEKYLAKEGDGALSPITRKKFTSQALYPAVHVRNNIEHLVESGIIEGELADTWKVRMAEKKRNGDKIKKWTEQAEKGDTDAMYELALSYAMGEHGLEEDDSKAYFWYKKGADARDFYCMAMAGYCLTNGCGTAKNPSEGLILLSLAAGPEGKGSDYACHCLGEVYFDGLHGVRKDNARAKYWFEKAVGEDCKFKHLMNKHKVDAWNKIEEIKARGGAVSDAEGEAVDISVAE